MTEYLFLIGLSRISSLVGDEQPSWRLFPFFKTWRSFIMIFMTETETLPHFLCVKSTDRTEQWGEDCEQCCHGDQAFYKCSQDWCQRPRLFLLSLVRDRCSCVCVCVCVNKEEAGPGRALVSLILNTQISASHDLIQKLSKSLFPPQRHLSTFYASLALCSSPPSLITSSFVSLTFLVLIAFFHALIIFSFFSVTLQSLPQYILANVSTVLHL